MNEEGNEKIEREKWPKGTVMNITEIMKERKKKESKKERKMKEEGTSK
jgi:hypothetical protein